MLTPIRYRPAGGQTRGLRHHAAPGRGRGFDRCDGRAPLTLV